MDLPVVCLDACHAKAALSMQVNKTDTNDAYGLAQIVRTGYYREVKVESMESHVIRSLLAVWSQLIRVRTQMSNQLRVKKWSKLKAWGVRSAVRVGFKKAKVAVAKKLYNSNSIFK